MCGHIQPSWLLVAPNSTSLTHRVLHAGGDALHGDDPAQGSRPVARNASGHPAARELVDSDLAPATDSGAAAATPARRRPLSQPAATGQPHIASSMPATKGCLVSPRVISASAFSLGWRPQGWGWGCGGSGWRQSRWNSWRARSGWKRRRAQQGWVLSCAKPALAKPRLGPLPAHQGSNMYARHAQRTW